MSKRKFGFEGFGIKQQAPTSLTPADDSPPQAPRRSSPPRRVPHDNYEDHDVDDIAYDEEENKGALQNPQTDEDIDPLDAFMAGIHEEVQNAPANPKPNSRIEELEDEEDDPMESFLNARRDAGLSLAAEALHAGYDSDEEVYAAAKAVDAGSVDYDSDDIAIITIDKKKIEPLTALDHSEIDYEPFNKDFYEEKPSISGMNEEDVFIYRQSLAIKVSGFDVPRPIGKFEDLGFDSLLMSAISKQNYEKPTPIQCQALPTALSGRDIIGIAKTGSGKTAAFVFPMVIHILDQEELGKGEGPIGVVCAPTRELAQQIYTETKKFAKPYGIRVSGIFGGMSKFEQFKELKAGCEIVVATPGRLIDMIKMKALTMLKTTYLVLDEADSMFDLGFEPQVRSIVGQIRPDRQTLLFSATMKKKVEKLAREILSDPVRITVGEVGGANEDITQIVTVLPSDEEKLLWLFNKLPGLIDEGDVLVFASTKVRVEEVDARLRELGFKVAALHGDKDQASRVDVLQKFKAGVYHVLVATDVAARGLDIKSIKSVVNVDCAKDMDSHVHRIGRTGRAGDKEGVAFTLLTNKEARFAGELVTSLIAAGQNVPSELLDLAMKDGRFRARREERRGGRKGGGKGRFKGGGGGGSGGGGRSVRGVDFGLGLGYKPDSETNKASQANKKMEIPNRGVAVDALKVGMMARFKSSFVAASSGGSGSTNFSAVTTQQLGQNPAHHGRSVGGIGYGNGKGLTLSGFVSGGSIGGGMPQQGQARGPPTSSAHAGNKTAPNITPG
ncbi:hypothetical protein L7F22_028512 [Adiantum nelumboides]|nr:hypothetical protein [Adiantum nelumboides]